MPTYRRIVEIDTHEQKNLFRTVRLDSDSPLSPLEIREGFADIIDTFRSRYETSVRFQPPRMDQILPGYQPQLPGEDNWDWGEEEYEDF